MALGKLRLAMLLSLVLLFGFVTAVIGVLLYWYGGSIGGFWAKVATAVVLSVFVVGIQWAISPWIIKAFSNMRELKRSDYPEIYDMVERYAKKAKIRMPNLYLVADGTPNAFAFGRTKNSGNLAVHSGLINTLNKDEVEAVIAHEIGHIKHWDMAVMTIASMIPILVYYLVILFGRGDNRNRSFGGLIMVFIGAYVAQFISSLIVMYLGRQRELYADAFSAVATGKPANLRTALAKISYGFPLLGAKASNYQGMRSFYFADPINSSQNSARLHPGTASRLQPGTGKEVEDSQKRPQFTLRADEVEKAIHWEKTNSAASFSEFFSTHPRTYKRIEALQEIEKDIRNGKATLETV